jgi:hypothetical protein
MIPEGFLACKDRILDGISLIKNMFHPLLGHNIADQAWLSAVACIQLVM